MVALASYIKGLVLPNIFKERFKDGTCKLTLPTIEVNTIAVFRPTTIPIFAKPIYSRNDLTDQLFSSLSNTLHCSFKVSFWWTDNQSKITYSQLQFDEVSDFIKYSLNW